MAETELGKVHKLGGTVLSVYDEDYPKQLSQIFDPPAALYCLGERSILQTPCIALVGSRRCSPYGREVSQKLSRELAGLGLTVVSGLARGVDSHAHRGALDASGRTIAVLGCGVDVIYPKENRSLYKKVRERGCIVSEFPCGAFPAPQNFPIRNRVISGLSIGTIIAEASEYSGSLITARLTLEQNRELWAVPGNITRPGSYGPNYLIKQGAQPLLDIQDVLEQLPLDVLSLLKERVPVIGSTEGKEGSKANLNKVEAQVLKAIPVDESVHFERLLEQTDLEVGELAEALLNLEMEELVRQLPGRKVCRKLK
jgi:DNA processing protein